MRAAIAISLTLLVGLTGCQLDPWNDGFVTRKVRDSKIVGKYVMDAQSQKLSIRVPGSDAVFPVSSSAQIVFSADHNAQFIKVPDYIGTDSCSITGRGSWQLEKRGKFTVVLARIVNEEKGSPCKGDFGYEVMLYGDRPPYKLNITIGDPDSGAAVQFEKVQ